MLPRSTSSSSFPTRSSHHLYVRVQSVRIAIATDIIVRRSKISPPARRHPQSSGLPTLLLSHPGCCRLTMVLRPRTCQFRANQLANHLSDKLHFPGFELQKPGGLLSVQSLLTGGNHHTVRKISRSPRLLPQGRNHHPHDPTPNGFHRRGCPDHLTHKV